MTVTRLTNSKSTLFNLPIGLDMHELDHRVVTVLLDHLHFRHHLLLTVEMQSDGLEQRLHLLPLGGERGNPFVPPA